MSQQPPAPDRDEDEAATRRLDRATAAVPQEFGRYRILRAVGQRSAGTVYLAHDTSLGRDVLLQVPSLLGGDGPVAERFVRAARAAAVLSHPNLCPILDAGQHEGVPYLTMPVLEGEPLAAVLASGGPWPAERAADLVRKLALAMQAAHQKDVLHRDLSAACVLLTPNGEPILTDFGLARQEGSARLTVDGQVLGTPGYLAPETLAGDLDRDGPSRDIYALGALLYELLTGQLPHGRTMREVIALSARPTQPPSHHRRGVPASLDAVCLKALARSPAERYRSMADFATAIRGWLELAETAPEDDDAIVMGMLPNGSSRVDDEEEKATRILPARSAKAAVVGTAPIAHAERDIRKRSRWPLLVGGVVVVAGLVIGAMFLRPKEEQRANETEVSSRGGTQPEGKTVAPIPDGKDVEKTPVPPKDKEEDVWGRERKAAEWALGILGADDNRLELTLEDGTKVEVKRSGVLPPGRFHISGLDLLGNARVTEYGLSRLTGLKRLEFYVNPDKNKIIF